MKSHYKNAGLQDPVALSVFRGPKCFTNKWHIRVLEKVEWDMGMLEQYGGAVPGKGGEFGSGRIIRNSVMICLQQGRGCPVTSGIAP